MSKGDLPTRTSQVIACPPRLQAKPADPCAMVIFGAGGDLTKRLVVPALYNLSRTNVLPEKFALIGVDLAQGTAKSWRDHLYDMLRSFVGNTAAPRSLTSTGSTRRHGNGLRRLAATKLGLGAVEDWVEQESGKPSVHPLRGDEIRALRELRRQFPDSAFVFATERGG